MEDGFVVFFRVFYVLFDKFAVCRLGLLCKFTDFKLVFVFHGILQKVGMVFHMLPDHEAGQFAVDLFRRSILYHT